MKYLGLLVVIAFMGLTWKWSQSEKPLSVSEQLKLTQIIRDHVIQAVKKQVPQSTDIRFSKLYTEVLEPGEKMRAHFSFSYSETEGEIEDIRRYRKGSFFITSADGNNWNAKIEGIDDIKIEFVEPQAIGAEPSEEEKTAETPDDDQSKESHGHE